MVTMYKMLLYLGLVMMSVAMAGIGSAQLMPENFGIEQRDIAEPLTDLKQADEKDLEKAGPPPTGVPVWVLISEQGIARKDNSSYALRIIVERLIPMEPRRIQELMSSDKSLEEIKNAIGASQEESIYHGSMKLDERIYPLINIRMIPYTDDISILDADVAWPNYDPALINEIEVIGHIQMTLAPSKHGIVGEGELWINDGNHSGTHSVLIEIAAPCDSKMTRENGKGQGMPPHSQRSPSDDGE
jgi:hypothetical protein